MKVICFNCWMKDDMAIDIANGTVTLKSGNVKLKITTQGWQLLMLWKDKLMSWVKLKDLKASNPVELAEYAVANWIAEEPAFKWDVSYHTWLKKHWRVTRKWGTDHWQRALNKEMSKVRITWNAHDNITPDDF